MICSDPAMILRVPDPTPIILVILEIVKHCITYYLIVDHKEESTNCLFFRNIPSDFSDQWKQKSRN